MRTGLEGKAAVVTGASRGIGRRIALALAEEGCRLVICARGREALEEAARELEARGSRVAAVSLDVTDPGAARTLVESAVRAFGGLDVVVNNVGGSRRKPFAETTDEDWTYVLELNLLSGLRLAREAIPVMRERGGGSIIFVSSIWGREAGPPGLSLYVTAKAAVIAASKMMALELARDGIRVNAVAPGSIRFPGGSWDRRVEADPEGMARWVEEHLPRGSFGTVEEVAAAVVFLASEGASLVTGACLPVDGAQGRSLL